MALTNTSLGITANLKSWQTDLWRYFFHRATLGRRSPQKAVDWQKITSIICSNKKTQSCLKAQNTFGFHYWLQLTKGLTPSPGLRPPVHAVQCHPSTSLIYRRCHIYTVRKGSIALSDRASAGRWICQTVKMQIRRLFSLGQLLISHGHNFRCTHCGKEVA